MEHVDAVWRHLPDWLKGERRYGARVTAKGLDANDVVMIGGVYDFERVPEHFVIYVEHGAGQSYSGDRRSKHHPAYHGTPHHPGRVLGYIAPRQEVADQWDQPSIAAGAPICDDYDIDTGNEHPLAAITFHWDAVRICPEAGSALDHYADHLGEIVQHLREQGFAVVGHSHPREHRLPMMWRNLGVEIVDARVVRSICDLLIADNTSLMYEMAYLGRSVVALNCPEYRRDVHHGLRFWEAAGLQLDSPAEVLAYDFTGWEVGKFAPHMASTAYDNVASNGQDGKRAAEWLTMLVTAM